MDPLRSWLDALMVTLARRQLEAELQTEKVRMQSMEHEFRDEIKKLQEDNDRQQKLISQVCH